MESNTKTTIQTVLVYSKLETGEDTVAKLYSDSDLCEKCVKTTTVT